jgi:hypothetical protein
MAKIMPAPDDRADFRSRRNEKQGMAGYVLEDAERNTRVQIAKPIWTTIVPDTTTRPSVDSFRKTR